MIIEVESRQDGPSQGRDIQFILSSYSEEILNATMAKITHEMKQSAELTDLQDTRPLPGIEWQMQIDRKAASRYNVSTLLVGTMIQMVTDGILLGTYRPDDSNDEVEVRVRFPDGMRTLSQFDNIMIPVNNRLIPISHFVKRIAVPKVGTVPRVNGKIAYHVEANVTDPAKKYAVTEEVISTIEEQLPPQVELIIRGDKEEQDESKYFLMNAFGVALFAMAIILVTQFNNFYQTLLILTAVIFSTIGVLIALMVKGQAFGIVMSGLGVIALAGIVVNNNIVLIDTYNVLRNEGLNAMSAAMTAGHQRLRPIILTSVTTILGLIPMAYQINLDFLTHSIAFDAPSSQWWTQLATAVAGGLLFATIVTLFVTPVLLILRERPHSDGNF